MNSTLCMIMGALVALAVGCAGDDEHGPETVDGSMLTLSFADLPALGSDYVYEGWMIVDGAPVTTGRFTIDGEGVMTPGYFEVDPEMSAAAALFVLTIEPAVGDDPAPAPTHVLAGPIVDGVAALTIGHEAALNSDFLDAAGSFILATPSSDSMDDETQGIWWINPPPDPTSSLQLPALPEGWAYEGWVVGADGPISTGTFTAVDQEDSDGKGDAAGPNGTPPFPGQDFIDPALDLVGLPAVISVEPSPDDSPAPFILKPLLLAEIGTATHTPQLMNNNAAATSPSGMAVFQ